MAINSMLKELDITDKPGLVSPISNGNHSDMDYFLMRRGIASLRKYFYSAFELGFFNKNFSALRELGKRYERGMFRATNGINTHKGSIFQLGILVYLIGRIKSKGIFITKENARKEISNEIEILGLKGLMKESSYGARQEVFEGYRLTFMSLEYSLDKRLYFIMSQIHDTNIIRRGGVKLLKEVQKKSRDVLKNKNKAKLYNLIDKNNLSPGGAADILINSIFIEDFFKFEREYLEHLKNTILDTKERVSEYGYEYKLVLSLVMPGFIKTDEKFLKYFKRYKKIYDRLLGIGEKIYDESGYRVIYNLKADMDFRELKSFSIELEKDSLIDIDIYGDKIYDRKQLGLPQRKCLVCSDFAKKCMIDRKHKPEEIIRKALEIVNEN